MYKCYVYNDGRQPSSRCSKRSGQFGRSLGRYGLDALPISGRSGNEFLRLSFLGLDVNALYVGCNMFSSAGAFVGTNGYVIQKSSILGAGPIFTTMFANLAAGAGAGPESPRGVDNYDSSATEGYFVGPDNASFSLIQFRRVSNPGSLTPTISANIPVTVPTTTLSGTQAVRLLQHAGNTGGNNGLLDSLDDRFYQAMIRNGRLWAAHNFTVTERLVSQALQLRHATRLDGTNFKILRQRQRLSSRERFSTTRRRGLRPGNTGCRR